MSYAQKTHYEIQWARNASEPIATEKKLMILSGGVLGWSEWQQSGSGLNIVSPSQYINSQHAESEGCSMMAPNRNVPKDVRGDRAGNQ